MTLSKTKPIGGMYIIAVSQPFNFCQTERELLIVWCSWHIRFLVGMARRECIACKTFWHICRVNFGYHTRYVEQVLCDKISGTKDICDQ